MTSITSFHGPHFCLSNFSESPVVFDGETYPTVEHAFQAAKTFDPEQRAAVRDAATPAAAKRLGRGVALRPDWEQVKAGLMHALLRQKFSRPDLRQALLDTGDAELIEGNTWGDRQWGCVLVKGEWIGKNQLGRLLMEVRAEMRLLWLRWRLLSLGLVLDPIAVVGPNSPHGLPLLHLVPAGLAWAGANLNPFASPAPAP